MTEDGTPGSTPILVLLPGLDGTGDFFQPLLKSLDPAIRTRVVRYPVDGGYDYATCTALARAALPADAPFVLLGESFSGPIAIELAAHRPRGLVGVILCVTFASNPRPRLAIVRPLLPYLPFHGSKAAIALSRFMVLGHWITPSVRALHMKILSMVPPSTMRARLLAVADCDARAALAQVRVPVLSLVAKADRLIPRSAARVIREHSPAATVIELHAPHCLLQCVPEKAAPLIAQFVHELS
jgi:pimeloyl-ACP methyl ester carboxylesterase